VNWEKSDHFLKASEQTDLKVSMHINNLDAHPSQMCRSDHTWKVAILASHRRTYNASPCGTWCVLIWFSVVGCDIRHSTSWNHHLFYGTIVEDTSNIQMKIVLVCFECRLQEIIKIAGHEIDITWIVSKPFEVLFELNKSFHSLALLNSLQLLKGAKRILLMLGFQNPRQTYEGLDRKEGEES